MASARPLRVYTLLDFSLAGCSVLEQHKGLSCSAGLSSYKNTKVAAAAAAGFLERGLFVENVKFLKEAERFCYGASVSQGDATEKLAHQVAAQVAAAHRRVEEASGDPHEEEKDEAHKSSKGHVSEPAVGCRTSLETFEGRVCSLDMEDKEEEDLCVGSLPQQRTIIQGSQNRVKQEDEPQRLRPPD
ncbi:Ribosome-binding factor A [Dissostichus eleginoides]|uniref:Ribosome-binding factor A n=1 Tax=Dissostichus eleginoides TaxID=100907 RepID=A0AAD9BML7_DISEL|nr:Ribosome-binding factor A [Dissostichus eleginoides]